MHFKNTIDTILNNQRDQYWYVNEDIKTQMDQCKIGKTFFGDQ